jgi:phthalate 4,5-dioxygenase oxygenase subunit
MMFFSMSKRRSELTLRAATPDGRTSGGLRYHSNSTDWLGRFRLVQDAANDYLIDRDKQRGRQSFTGVEGVPVQDALATESMGSIADRSQEHLASGDSMVIRTRRRLLDAVRALQNDGTVPPGVDEPEVYLVRSGGVILPRDTDWIEGTQRLREAFVDHSDLDLAVVGENA